MCSYSQGTSIQNRETKRCLEIALGSEGYYQLVVRDCSGQSWKIQHLIKGHSEVDKIQEKKI